MSAYQRETGRLVAANAGFASIAELLSEHLIDM
jgi:hypothetical protein